MHPIPRGRSARVTAGTDAVDEGAGRYRPRASHPATSAKPSTASNPARRAHTCLNLTFEPVVSLCQEPEWAREIAKSMFARLACAPGLHLRHGKHLVLAVRQRNTESLIVTYDGAGVQASHDIV